MCRENEGGEAVFIRLKHMTDKTDKILKFKISHFYGLNQKSARLYFSFDGVLHTRQSAKRAYINIALLNNQAYIIVLIQYIYLMRYCMF